MRKLIEKGVPKVIVNAERHRRTPRHWPFQLRLFLFRLLGFVCGRFTARPWHHPGVHFAETLCFARFHAFSSCRLVVFLRWERHVFSRARFFSSGFAQKAAGKTYPKHYNITENESQNRGQFDKKSVKYQASVLGAFLVDPGGGASLADRQI